MKKIASTGLGDLADLRLEPNHALFIDFDGTLAELNLDPDVVEMPSAISAALGRLSERLGGAVAILSGRGLPDLARRTPSVLWRAGGHGLEIAAPGAALPPSSGTPPEEVLAPLKAAAEIDGVRLEIKGPVAALHFRAAPDAQTACIEAAKVAAQMAPGHLWQAGKMVVEVKPERAHKGRTLRLMTSLAPFVRRTPIMIGDDTTDEDAIEAAQALGGIGVRVGSETSVARFRTPDVAAVRAWILREAQ
jgi:trehalose 6-phosphate phosphatase